MSHAHTSVIVLAADRGAGDPLAVAVGAPGKVLVEIGGKSMLSRVMETVAAFASGDAQVILVCRDHPDYAAAADVGCSFHRLDPEAGPAASAAAALDLIEKESPVVLVTGDHPLLEPAWMVDFVKRARAVGADAAVGLVDYATIARRFPESRRTRYRFADVSVCGANLFYFHGPGGRRVAQQWRAFEADRKKPWKIIGRLGPWNLLRYLTGRLSLSAALEALSRRMGVRLAGVMLNAPEAAVDVDSRADFELVTEIIERREVSWQ